MSDFPVDLNLPVVSLRTITRCTVLYHSDPKYNHSLIIILDIILNPNDHYIPGQSGTR